MITCRKCRALLEPGTRSCPYCATDQRHQLAPSEAEDAARTTRFGLWLVGVIAGLYALMLLLDPAKADTSATAPSTEALVMFGWAQWQLVHLCGQYWRLLASMFLHADLLHLLLNCVGFLYLIPIAAHTFGSHRTVCLFFGSGLCGAALSTGVGNSGLGASGALCGLIAAAAAYGWRRGGSLGRELTSGMVSWAVMILLFGLFVRVDHAGHIGGFLGGAAFGWLAAAARARGGQVDRAWALAARAAIALALLVGAVFWTPFFLRGFERREVELYRDEARRVLGLASEALEGRDAGRLPSTFPDGPRGTGAVGEAIREALALVRRGDPRAGDAVGRARAVWRDWSRGLFCSHGLRSE